MVLSSVLRDYIFVSPVKHSRHIGIMSSSMSLLLLVSLRFATASHF